MPKMEPFLGQQAQKQLATLVILSAECNYPCVIVPARPPVSNHFVVCVKLLHVADSCSLRITRMLWSIYCALNCAITALLHILNLRFLWRPVRFTLSSNKTSRVKMPTTMQYVCQILSRPQ
ncbi:hypothetical protein M378DRAFT_213445 [Amanita muscaria Koide BX008]|uniref:Uncharacterized protein n=1 Tax=Amanita muscaria (strain Koide BX008) TaxID=946122 RepID=A0A0C2XAD4_AMAMK|nr:hypothetical protein M378DRAFT_213445 [Amanita muscaria Koide BX008]